MVPKKLFLLIVASCILKCASWCLFNCPEPAAEQTKDDCSVKCGRRPKSIHRQEFRILGGEVEDPKEWPWMFEMKTTDCDGALYFCTAQLISKKHLITAGHCLFRNFFECIQHPSGKKKTNYVPYATSDVKVEHQGVEYAIKNFSVPSNFDENAPVKVGFVDDIAVIELQDEIANEQICLPDSFDRPLEPTAFLVGYGSHGDAEIGEKLHDRQMRKVEINFAQLETCRSIWGPRAVMCAGDEGQGGLIGDSGAALTTFDELTGLHFAQGILSRIFASTPNRHQQPDIYVSVLTYCSWISEVTNEMAKCVSPYSIPPDCLLKSQRSEDNGPIPPLGAAYHYQY